MSLSERYHGYDFARMNRERSSASDSQPTDQTEQSPVRIPYHPFTTDAMTLQGRERIWDNMAQGIPGSALDIRKDKIRDALSGFLRTEHRLESVMDDVYGVRWINDSKATNVNSAWYALECMDRPVVWIAGGVDKGNDYGPLVPLVKAKVKAIVVLGNAMKFHHSFSRIVDMAATTNDMMEAVAMARRLASKGDAVLLSPACASFDIFQDYQDRGRQFKDCVRNLI